MTGFPPDLICEILRLLPVTSLLRFKCVSKSFHHTIDSRGFIHSHLDTTLEHKTHRKLVFQKNPQLVPIHVLDFDDPFQPLPDFLLKDPPPETDNASDCDDSNDDDRISQCSDADEDSGCEDGNINQTFKLYSRRFYGHCNGLVLMVEQWLKGGTFNSRLGAWNPFTRKHWTLQNDIYTVGLVDCSLGYDPLTDDYKVLLVYKILVAWECDCCFGDHHELWILGLRSGCRKKVGNLNPRRGNCWTTDDVCFVDGAFYFNLYEHGAIYAVDVSTEMLSLVSLPDDINKDTHYIGGLQVLEGSICVRFSRQSRDGNYEEEEEELYYVRKKKGNSEFVWMKLLSTKYENGIEGGKLGYSKRRDKWFILHIGFEFKVYLYDFEEKSIERLSNGDMKHRVRVMSCVESLASLDRYLVEEEEEEEDNGERKSDDGFSFGEFVQFCK